MLKKMSLMDEYVQAALWKMKNEEFIVRRVIIKKRKN